MATNRRIFSTPTPTDEACRFITTVRAQVGHINADTVSVDHLEHLQEVCTKGEATGSLLPDAVLAAMAVEHGGEVISFDRDFGRFPGLRWRSPADG